MISNGDEFAQRLSGEADRRKFDGLASLGIVFGWRSARARTREAKTDQEQVIEIAGFQMRQTGRNRTTKGIVNCAAAR